MADAITYAAHFADLLSCSWSGPRNNIIETALAEVQAGIAGPGCEQLRFLPQGMTSAVAFLTLLHPFMQSELAQQRIVRKLSIT